MSSENLYSSLLQAWSVAKTSDANTYGVEIAIVTNTSDPGKQGRVKVCFPRLPGKPESDWARVSQPSAGPGRGFYWLPEVSDEVLVAFERGQSNLPYVLGALWNGKDKPMKDAYTDDNTTRMIQTKSGHQIVLSDKSGEEKMVIADGSGKRAITFDVKEKKFLIECGKGDFNLKAEKKLVLLCEDLEIKTKKTGKIEIGTKFDLKVAQKASFKAGPKWDIKADKINLNPPDLSLEALAGAIAGAIAGAAAAAAAGGNAAEGAAAGAAAGFDAAGNVPSHDVLAGAAAGAAAGAGAGGAAAAGAAGPTGAAAPGGTDWTKAPAGGAAGSSSGGTSGGTPGTAGTSGAGGASAAGGAGGATSGEPAKPLAPAEQNDIVVKVTDASGNPVPNLAFELTLPDGTVKKGSTGSGGEVEARGLAKGGDYKITFPELDKGGDAPAPAPADPGDQLDAGMVGAALFAGIVPGALADAEQKFILSLAKRESSNDEHVRLMRLVFKGYRVLGASAPVAAGMTAQFVVESDWGRACTGRFNYFGFKGKPGTLCKTFEHNLSDAYVAQLQSEGRLVDDKVDEKGVRVTTIMDWFRDFESLSDAMEKKYGLLHGGGPHNTYGKHQVMESPTPEAFCKRIREAGYATAVNYTDVLIGRLKAVDSYAKAKKGNSVQVIQETANAPIDPSRFDGGSFG